MYRTWLSRYTRFALFAPLALGRGAHHRKETRALQNYYYCPERNEQERPPKPRKRPRGEPGIERRLRSDASRPFGHELPRKQPQ